MISSGEYQIKELDLLNFFFALKLIRKPKFQILLGLETFKKTLLFKTGAYTATF